MLLEKIKKKNVFFGIIIFSIVFFATRLPYLKQDVVNPDAVNWHYRSQQFINGLKYQQFEKTYQHYHPGVTLMWITGSAVEIFKQVTGADSYNHINFPSFHLISKLSLICVQFLLSFIIIFLLTRIFDFGRAVTITSLFSLEPFFLGNSRLYHMDVLFTLLVFVSLLFCFLLLKEKKIMYGMLAGLFSALSFLTKSVGIGVILYIVAFVVGYTLFIEKDLKKLAKYVVVLVILFIVSTFVFFPALWIDSVGYLTKIFEEASRVGIQKGHGQVIFGEYTRNGGYFFYPLVFLIKSSPFLVFGVVLSLLTSSVKKLKLFSFSTFLAIFYLGYLGVMVYSSKKIDRYFLVLFPWLAYLAINGFANLYNKYAKKAVVFLLVSCVLFIILPVFTFFPYYFVYASPLVGGTVRANEIIQQKPFGVGVFELKDHFISKFRDEVTVGMIDTKPLRSIYPNSRVFDMRVYGSSKYDIFILHLNEEVPSKIEKGQFEFKKDSSVYINGLEYWKIYVKEGFKE